jgi:hypothetical protein
MDFGNVFASMVFGVVGIGLFLYGKKNGRLVPLAAGLALMTVPYFIPNVLALVAVCCAITTLPWLLRNA